MRNEDKIIFEAYASIISQQLKNWFNALIPNKEVKITLNHNNEQSIRTYINDMKLHIIDETPTESGVILTVKK